MMPFEENDKPRNNAVNEPTAVVVTSIAGPNPVMRQIAADCLERGIHFYVIGDLKSPSGFSLNGCDFFSIQRQTGLDLLTPARCPTGHYARKNIGYLQAMRDGAKIIIETDDDNMPGKDFYSPLASSALYPTVERKGWVNVYRYNTDRNIWPRGLPLDALSDELPEVTGPARVDCPIQQGLADDNPDVDAIYRLVMPLPISFSGNSRIALTSGVWCPFNSQNTTFYEKAFPLLYLPSYCSFRMTDIWRSFVAQRIAWENGWSILFREATVKQSRNEHNLLRDFEDEIPGYLHNRKIASVLESLSLHKGEESIPTNLRRCYEALVVKEFIDEKELALLDAWLNDLQTCRRSLSI